ncbi:MAG TPA: NUDIX domain-containing protein [Aromatoleum sp.]|uniref:NUDIX domain-containing protein n=1 Tax=Aromatoleum sp. TaxID=2307007 RepID=UPI002B4791E0|nr:NUDIX domain-containing protein [Aromatoleum sp.]HJV27639.1 NUDIX domain-containing protein [Aromatoleum sp.]
MLRSIIENKNARALCRAFLSLAGDLRGMYDVPVQQTTRRSAPIGMTANQLSCGLLVINECGALLVGHSTGAAHWDLPKGLIEAGEDPMTCALREAREEFGLDFGPERLIDLGRHAYYRGKDLHLFAVGTSSAETRLELCHCISYFEHYTTGQRVPEVDDFAWADDAQLDTMLAKSMRRLLLDKALLSRARNLVRI